MAGSDLAAANDNGTDGHDVRCCRCCCHQCVCSGCSDEVHPSALTQHTNACVLYAAITGLSPCRAHRCRERGVQLQAPPAERLGRLPGLPEARGEPRGGDCHCDRFAGADRCSSSHYRVERGYFNTMPDSKSAPRGGSPFLVATPHRVVAAGAIPTRMACLLLNRRARCCRHRAARRWPSATRASADRVLTAR